VHRHVGKMTITCDDTKVGISLARNNGAVGQSFKSNQSNQIKK